MSLVELVLEIHRHLSRSAVAHAFGGALALAYIAEPRGTVDIDVNVFSPAAELDAILRVFAELGLEPEEDRTKWLPIAGIRLRRATDPFPVDVFPSLDDRYAEIERRCARWPFGPDEVELPFLCAEDLTLFKLSFGRAKDWYDVRAIARARPDLDIDAIDKRLISLRGPSMHPRIARLRAMLREGAT